MILAIYYLSFFFQRGVAVRFSDTLLEETGWVWNFFHSGIAHFGDPRVGQLGHEKRRLKFSRTGKRAQGIILLTNQFYDIFECLSVFVPNQRSASIGLLSWSHKKDFTCKLECSPCTSLARAGEFFGPLKFVNLLKFSPQWYKRIEWNW